MVVVETKAKKGGKIMDINFHNILKSCENSVGGSVIRDGQTEKGRLITQCIDRFVQTECLKNAKNSIETKRCLNLSFDRAAQICTKMRDFFTVGLAESVIQVGLDQCIKNFFNRGEDSITKCFQSNYKSVGCLLDCFNGDEVKDYCRDESARAK